MFIYERKMKIVQIKWIDSCASNQNWNFIQDFDGDIEPIKIISVGFLLQENDDVVTIAQNYGTDPEQVCNLMTIPKGCIKQITTIEDE